MMTLRSAALAACAVIGCASTHPGATQANELDQQANATIAQMEARNPSLTNVLHSSYGYVVFPSIGKAAFLGGGAFGRGVLFEQGLKTGYVKLQQASFGLQAGGSSYAQVVVLQNRDVVDQLKSGTYELGADASVIILTAGAQASPAFRNGVVVYVMPRGGAIAGISVTGQKLDYAPAG